MHLSLLVASTLLLATSLGSSIPTLRTRDVEGPDNSPEEYTSDDKFKHATLDTHNLYRQQHNVTDLKWNDTLAEIATEWAERCVFEHSVRITNHPYHHETTEIKGQTQKRGEKANTTQGGETGENLSSGYPNATESIRVWGEERDLYDFGDSEPQDDPQKDSGSGFSEEAGHFTQLVWKETTSVGCGRAHCGGGKEENGGDGEEDKAPGWFVVCEYWPYGNVQGAFDENVMQGDWVKESGSPVAGTYVGRGGLIGVAVGVVIALVGGLFI